MPLPLSSRSRKRDAAPTKARPRTLPLLLGLAAVALVWVIVNVATIRTFFLYRQDLAELRVSALKPGADSLTRLILARRLVAAGHADEAVPLLQALVGELPAEATGAEAQGRLAELAHALAVSNRLDEAAPVLERAQRLDPRDVLLLLSSAWIDFHARRLDRAETAAKVIAGARPTEPEVWRLLGEIGNARRSESALAPLRKSIALAPDIAITHADLGNALAYRGKIAEAIPEFRTAIRLDPTQALHRRSLGEALAIAARTPDEHREARTFLAEAVAAEPQNVLVVYKLAQLEVRSEALDDARTHLRQTLALRPDDSEAWYLLWYVERRLGDPGAADAALANFRLYAPRQDRVQIAQSRVATRPADARRRLELARAYARAQNPVGAYWQLRAARQMDPATPVDATLAASIDADYARYRKTMGDAPDDPNRIGPPPIGGTKKE